MGKIIVDYDISSSKLEFYINNIKVEDVFSVLLHRDMTNSYKYTVEIISDEGRTTVKNGNVESSKNDKEFLEKFLSYFRSDENE